MSDKNIIILGAGLTGLTIGYYLSLQNIPFTILEARDRIGGRILTTTIDTPIELGATWIVKQQTQIHQLLKELNIEVFEQVFGQTAIYEPMSNTAHQLVQLPKNQESSYRIKGGTSHLIQKLASKIDNQNIILNTPVSELIFEKQDIEVKTQNGTVLKADKIINTLPPNLFSNSIKTTPKLSNDFINIADNTHTWMGESTKVGFSYKIPFWRTNHLSGTIFSNVGPITEMYDHSTFEDNKHALKGFFSNAYHHISKDERKELALKQLEKYYGKQVRNYLSYQETVWNKETYTAAHYEDFVYPHNNNGDTQYQKSYFNNRLFFAGAETNPEFPGYMEGAVRSALTVLKKIKL